MNTEKLCAGDIYKNYKELCGALGVEPKTSGNAKLYQLKEIGRFIKYNKKGHSFIVVEVYDKPIGEALSRGSNNTLPFAEELELLLIDLLLENNRVMTKSNSRLLQDLCMINNNYYEYFSNKELLSTLLEMDLNHIEDWYDATNSSFKGYLQTVLRKLESKKMIIHEIIVMVVLEYKDEESGKLKTMVRNAKSSEIQFILEIEGELLDEYECKTVQDVYKKGLIKEYYKELSSRLYDGLKIKRSYKANKIHINNDRLSKEKLERLDEWKLLTVKSTINNGMKNRVIENANNRQQVSLALNPFVRTHKQTIRSEATYLSNVETLNNSLIDISNIIPIKIESVEDAEFESYVLEQMPFE